MAVEPDPDRIAGRRAYDTVAPAISLAIEETVGETRHLLRGEFTAALLGLSNKVDALAKAITEGTLQSTREHTEVKASVDELRQDVVDLRELVPRVSELERHDIDATARNETQEKILKHVEQGRRWLIATCIAAVSVVIAAASVLLAVLT